MDLADDLAAGGPQRQLSRFVRVRQRVSGQFANRNDQITHPVRRQASPGRPPSCEAADTGQISPVPQHLSIGRGIAQRSGRSVA
jgi:hypothetical protein